MNKIKAFFKYLWENLFDRYTIVVLNVYNTIAFFAMLYLLQGYLTSTCGGALGWFFWIVYAICINLVFFVILTIVFFFESKGKIKRIKNNSIFNNKFYRVISILNVLFGVFFHYFLLLYFILWYILTMLEDIFIP